MALTGCRLQGRRRHHLCEPFLWAGSLPTSSCSAPRLGCQSQCRRKQLNWTRDMEALLLSTGRVQWC